MRTLPYVEDPPPAPPDFYATSLTTDDVVALDTFLRARCKETYRRYRPDAPEARMAQSYLEAAGCRVDDLWDTLVTESSEGLSKRVEAWNYLIYIVEPWRGTPGHDGQRWRLLDHTDEMAARRERRPR